MNVSVSRFQADVNAPRVPLARSFERRRLRIYIGQMLTDTLCILVGFVLGGGLYLGNWPAPIALLEAQVLMPVYLTLATRSPQPASSRGSPSRTSASTGSAPLTLPTRW